MTQAPASGGFGIYVHWPFCLSKCPYCDFNSHVRDSIDQARWRRALLADLEHAARLTGKRRVDAVFFGGGTPSLMEPETTAAIIARIGELWDVPKDVEITLEANPTSVEAGRFRAFRAGGVNRVSLGIQSLDPAGLKFLGRTHDRDEALRAIATAADNFPRFSFDLIYARPGQTPAAWEAELRQALDLAVCHLSLYQLTIEQGTAFYNQHARGDFQIPDEDAAASLFELTQHILEAAGLPAYEISNHARPGQESRHNLIYWRYGDYVGVGPGAHGRVDRHATRCHRAPETWLDAVERAGHGIEESLSLDAEARLLECLMMGLRLAEGISRARFIDSFDKAPEDLLDMRAAGYLIEGGFLTLNETGIAATAAGRQRLNAVLAKLIG